MILYSGKAKQIQCSKACTLQSAYGFSINSISPITDRGVLKQRSNDLPLESNVVTLYFPCTKKYI